MAQSVEHILGKDEVTSSSLVSSSIKPTINSWVFHFAKPAFHFFRDAIGTYATIAIPSLCSLQVWLAAPSNPTRKSWGFYFIPLQTLTYSKTEREPQRRRERECRAPDESTPVDGIHSKPPSTSGIMRVLSLTCESRVCPLCVANEGKHVRKGWLFT